MQKKFTYDNFSRDRANLAAACGGIIFFLLFLPYNLVYAFEEDMTLATKIIAVSEILLAYLFFGVVCFLMHLRLVYFFTQKFRSDVRI